MPQSEAQKRATPYPVSKKSAPATNTKYKNPEAGTVDLHKDLTKEYANQIQGTIPGYQDPFNGVDPLTALLTQIHNGSSGGSGKSGSSGASAAALAARNAALDAAFQQENASLDLLGQQQNAGFDARDASLRGIQSGADQRLTGILGDLTAGAGAARGATSAAYAGGDQRLQALQGEYAKIAQNRDTQANGTLGAFGGAAGGAQGSVAPSGAGVQDMLFAGRAANTMRGNAADELYAQRGNVYNGLGADAKLQNGQGFDALLAKLAMDRQAQSQSIAQQRAQIALQQAQAKV